MKYASIASTNDPKYNEERTHVIGFNLCYGIECRGIVVEAKYDYTMPEAEWFPVSELTAKGSDAVWQGMLAHGLVEQAEAEMDDKIAALDAA